MDDIVIQFARLWGQMEVDGWTKDACRRGEEMRQYDSLELMELLKRWTNEYFEDESADDTVEFFENKIKQEIKW